MAQSTLDAELASAAQSVVERLRADMIETGYSAKGLAHESGVPITRILGMLQGERISMTDARNTRALRRLARAMGFSDPFRYDVNIPLSGDFNERVRAARMAMGWTQKELAARARVKKGTIGRIEADPQYFPGEEIRERLASALSLELDQ